MQLFLLTFATTLSSDIITPFSMGNTSFLYRYYTLHSIFSQGFSRKAPKPEPVPVLRAELPDYRTFDQCFAISIVGIRRRAIVDKHGRLFTASPEGPHISIPIIVKWERHHSAIQPTNYQNSWVKIVHYGMYKSDSANYAFGLLLPVDIPDLFTTIASRRISIIRSIPLRFR